MRAFEACAILLWAVGVRAFILTPAARLGLVSKNGILQPCSEAVQSRRSNNRAKGLSMATQSPRRRDRGGPSGEPNEQSERAMKNMLSEAAMASVVYYWLEFRDDLHPQWLKSFTRSIGEIQDIGWQQHMFLLMRAEPEEILVRHVAQLPRGGSGDNPYLKPNRTAMEYTVIIQPQDIAKKIMEVREQISCEWLRDLELVEAENYELARHREDAMGLGHEDAERDRRMVFDHDPLNNTDSPYRGKNYKLLLDMITKAAIKAYRSELRITGDRFTLNWVERFMQKNDVEGGPKLTGNKLLEAVLDGPIVMIKDPRTEKNRVIDPSNIGRQIMAFRVIESKRVMKFMSSIADDHMVLNRQFLEERFKDKIEDVVLTQRRRRIVEAMSPKESIFPSPESIEEQGDFEM